MPGPLHTCYMREGLLKQLQQLRVCVLMPYLCVQHAGQVYIPLMNYLLAALCLIITGTFQTSDNIGKAYGKILSSMHAYQFGIYKSFYPTTQGLMSVKLLLAAFGSCLILVLCARHHMLNSKQRFFAVSWHMNRVLSNFCCTL